MLTRFRIHNWGLRTAVLAVVFSLTSASSQQPPAAAGGRGGGRGPGGGFTKPEPIDYNDHEGWKSLFDGATLSGWEGNLKVWRFEDGAIVGESKPDNRVATTYLIWTGGEPVDFELKAEMKAEGVQMNTGIQYRSYHNPDNLRCGMPTCPPQPAGTPGPGRAGGAGRGGPVGIPADPKWNLGGYQFDFDFVNRFSGNLYEQASPRGEVAWRGEIVRTETGKKPRSIAHLGNADELAGYIKINDWNQLHLIARGNELIHIINGQTMTIMVDDDPSLAKAKGVIALQIEGVGKVSFRNIWLKTL